MNAGEKVKQRNKFGYDKNILKAQQFGNKGTFSASNSHGKRDSCDTRQFSY